MTAALNINEITGVAFAGIRAVAMSETLNDLAPIAEEIQAAGKALDKAVETANAVAREDGETVPEDHDVVEAAKAYAKAEQKWLLTLEGYLTFAADFAYNELLFSDDEQSALLAALFPNA